MAGVLHQLGYFQFANLIQNRIPFSLLAVEFEVPPLFGEFHDRHIESQKVPVTKENFVSDVKKLELPKDRGIVLINQNGEGLSDLVDQLESMGFLNVYYVSGGFEALLSEKKML